jgi:hypothetical protein
LADELNQNIPVRMLYPSAVENTLSDRAGVSKKQPDTERVALAVAAAGT